MRRAAAIIAAITLTLSACGTAAPPTEPEERPDLHLMTSLPLLFGEAFGLDHVAPPVTRELERHFRLVPVDRSSDLAPGSTLLAIQPRALPAEQLVALDEWVRGGGRLVLLADPYLEWPSDRPLGDLLRPPVAFADTGLLKHWGLRLDAPIQRGRTERRIGGRNVTAISPGSLVREHGECRVDQGGFIARCALGEGMAIVIADADWIDSDRLEDVTDLDVLIELVRPRD